MKHVVVLAASLLLSSSLAMAASSGHDIVHPGDVPSAVGSAEYFTGAVRQDRLANPDASSPYGLVYVTFEPGARTFWHTHPAGQRLLVVAGKGLVGTADGKADVVRAGDYVWCPPNVLHFHGAAPDTAMTHLAMTNVKDGKSVEWKGAVSDAAYADAAKNAEDPLKK